MSSLRRTFHALGPLDVHNIGRDPLLKWMLVVPLLMAVLVRLGFPIVADIAHTRLGLDLTPFQPLIAGGLLLLPATLVGMVIGFLLLDERDDGTLLALLVTPLTLRQYFLYRLSWPLAVGTVLTAVSLPLTGLGNWSWGEIWLGAIVAAPLAPLLALLLAAVAENKVQGLALTKLISGVQMLPLVAYFVPHSFQWFFGLVPTFWVLRMMWGWAEQDPFAGLYGLVGLGYQLFLLWWLHGRVRLS